MNSGYTASCLDSLDTPLYKAPIHQYATPHSFYHLPAKFLSNWQTSDWFTVKTVRIGSDQVRGSQKKDMKCKTGDDNNKDCARE